MSRVLCALEILYKEVPQENQECRDLQLACQLFSKRLKNWDAAMLYDGFPGRKAKTKQGNKFKDLRHAGTQKGSQRGC